ncbi:acetylornithine deacetylase [Caulobacter sp. Root655]|uniref:acetylornithine deacetylase n=1 Tax=Caulobacter sp. Root655 TaxID=1736578 RepID=UPI0006F46CFE|nr:acetylornithine deacetylase [Caulobacter sp. Root655]KRA65868.1 acetylornithine deacetylase [Caulobacter sp. Root655]
MVSSSETLSARAVDILGTLVAFDTTSRLSNLALIEWVEAYLSNLGIASRRVPNHDGTKSNLLASIGPAIAGGVVLSGHTDVVPVDGQPWTSDPFVLTPRDGRLYGRGTCDMKGFLALALAAAPDLAAATLDRPVHLAFSYDEEIGCLGAPDMIAVIANELPRPALVVVGEPTDMVAVRGHKGISSFRVTVTGREAHSSLTHLGVSANMVAIKLMSHLVELSERLEREADPGSPFVPKGATLTIGQVNGGTALNILARECVFVFDLRMPAGMDAQAILADFFALAAKLDAEIKAKAPEGGVRVETRSMTPAFAPEVDGAAEVFARRIAGDNGPPRVVPYAAEAGQFQGAGFSTVICGPGSIDQAHQPDEYVEVSQMQRGAAFMRRLIEDLSQA